GFERAGRVRRVRRAKGPMASNPCGVLAGDGDRQGSGVHRAVLADSHDHLAQVTSNARDLLGALMVNMEWLKSIMPSDQHADVSQVFGDVDTCCERIKNLLEDGLLATRRGGLIPQ